MVKNNHRIMTVQVRVLPSRKKILRERIKKLDKKIALVKKWNMLGYLYPSFRNTIWHERKMRIFLLDQKRKAARDEIKGYKERERDGV